MYQRAVTPTLNSNDNNVSSGPVRGKVLSYNSNLVRGRSNLLVGGGSDKLSGSSAPPSPLQSRGTVLSPRANSGVSSDILMQGRTTSGKSFRGLHIEGGGEQPIPLSVMPRYDLVPLADELPPDGIIFARIRNQPDSLVVFRTPEERLRNPERLNLDRRQLEVCPLLEQEQRLRLLNFQNNNIRVIQNLENLPNLIFLDLYNNKITSLEGSLSTVKGLRVLMAGKNKIAAIANLSPLRKLDVLDLHSNEIRVVEGLEQLADLRVLNLAGNRISVVNNLSSLASLTELNLRRNSIEYVTGLDQLPALQRVFLSHNALSSMEDIKCLFDITYLIELSLDGNPLSEGDPARYRAQLVQGMPGLRHLDLRRVTDEERAGIVSGSASVAPPVPSADGSGAGGEGRAGQAEGLPPPYHLSRQVQDKFSLEDGTAGGDYSPRAAGGISMRHMGCNSDDEQRSSAADIDQQLQIAGAQDDGKQAVGGAGLSGGAKSERRGQQKYTNAPPSEGQGGTEEGGRERKDSVILGKGGSSGGLAALARSGQLFNTRSVFDLEIIGPDEKALIAVGDTWEWTPSKRLLLNVTEASLFHMKRSTIVAKFSAAQIAAMPALKCLRFVFDDFATLKSVEFIPQMYGHLVEHLTVKNCPLCTATSPKLLRSYFIASMPRLLSFNDVQVSADDRRVSESLYMPLIRMQQICPPAPSPAIAAAAPAPPGSSNGGVKVGSPQKQSSQQQSLLRVHQAQATRQLMQSFYVVGGPEADLQNQQALEQGPGTAAATTGSVTAELLSNMGSGSPWDVQPAGTQLGFSGAEAGVAASGLSGRALQRRRCSQAFEAAFDSLVLKVLQETLVEMKQLAR